MDMDYVQQQREISTIREKTVKIKLSEADCERILRLCGEYNITVGELLENFIGDLVDGTCTNGSDERELARKYFERCWFGMFPETTLLNWLLNNEYDVNNLIEVINNIKDGVETMEYIERGEEVYRKKEIETLKNDIEDWKKEVEEIKTAFCKDNKEADWEKEVENVSQWMESLELMKFE